MKKLILLSATLLSTAYASTSKINLLENMVHEKMDCKIEESLIESVYKTSSDKYNICQVADNFNYTLRAVKEIEPMAPTINLFIGRPHNNASFDMGRIIRMPVMLTYSGQWGLQYGGNPIATDIVLAHEYAHAIFSQKLKEYDFFKDVQKDSYRASSLELAIQQAYNKGNPGNIVSFYTNQLNKLQQERLNDPYSKKIRKVVSSFNELYADTVSAYLNDNKSAMVNALYHDQMTDSQYEGALSRDFANNSLDMKGSYLGGEHGKLAPTRRFIGKNLWPKTKKEKREKLDLLFKVIAAEIEEIIKYDLDFHDPHTLNESLIERLKTKLEAQE